MVNAALENIRALVGAIEDPEIPVLTLDDLGIIRGVEHQEGALKITITPTYSGCPATSVINELVVEKLQAHDIHDFQIVQSLSPPWSSAWISTEGQRKLEDYGIAPPNPSEKGRPQRCPQCHSDDVAQLSAFGPTPCQAIWKCNDCLETFNYFKCM